MVAVSTTGFCELSGRSPETLRVFRRSLGGYVIGLGAHGWINIIKLDWVGIRDVHREVMVMVMAIIWEFASSA